MGWDSENLTATLELDNKVLTMTIGEVVPGMDMAAMITNGRTMIPLRYISEALGYYVMWDSEARTIEITNQSESESRMN